DYNRDEGVVNAWTSGRALGHEGSRAQATHPDESIGDNGIPGLSPLGRFDSDFDRLVQGSRNGRDAATPVWYRSRPASVSAPSMSATSSAVSSRLVRAWLGRMESATAIVSARRSCSGGDLHDSGLSGWVLGDENCPAGGELFGWRTWDGPGSPGALAG